MVEPFALYVHIPFCLARCAYCDFNTYAGLERLMPDYAAALRTEIRAAPRGELRTLYFGGGTPSILPLDLWEAIWAELRAAFSVPPQAEVTLEANPGTVTRPYLRRLRELGVNRLSLGVQSAHDDELRFLGRIHTWAEAVQGVEQARAAGFDNLSLDFIYGLPHQSLRRWEETLRAALALEVEHLSLYALTVEEGTPLAGWIAAGRVAPPDDDLAAEMYELAEGMLGGAGFEHYEISNWAKPGRRCRHNLVYWRSEPWLGLGAGATSWWGGRRWSNVRHPAEYAARIARGEPLAVEAEEIGERLAMGEAMMMGLRLGDGVSEAWFRRRFGRGLEEVFGSKLSLLQEQGLLVWDGRTARLTPRGRLLGNRVFGRFLP